MEFDQGEFVFDRSEDEKGYRQWQERLREKRREIESRFGILLGTRVRVQLVGEMKPIEGMIILPEVKAPCERGKLKLQMGHREFHLSQVESISVIR